jgi:hypothetical protein
MSSIMQAIEERRDALTDLGFSDAVSVGGPFAAALSVAECRECGALVSVAWGSTAEVGPVPERHARWHALLEERS